MSANPCPELVSRRVQMPEDSSTFQTFAHSAELSKPRKIISETKRAVGHLAFVDDHITCVFSVAAAALDEKRADLGPDF